MGGDQQQIRIGGLRVDPHANRIELASGWVKLRPRSMAVLEYLAANAGQVCSRREIIDAVWGVAEVTDAVLTQAVRELRGVLEDDPGNPAVIETIPRVGYRLSAEVEQVLPREQRRTWSRSAIVSTVLLIAAAIGIGYWLTDGVFPRDAQVRRLAVLPFEHMGPDQSFDYFSDGLTEELITELNGINPDALEVLARTSVMHFKGGQVSLDEIARQLDVDYVVEGSVRREGERVRITAQLIDTDGQAHLWAESYDNTLRNILDLQRDVAQDIAKAANVSLTARATPPRAQVDPEAYRHFLRGKHHLYRDNHPRTVMKARDELEAAVRIEPDNAMAQAWLAAAYSYLGFSALPERRERYYRRARKAAEKALELDPELGIARRWLAHQAVVRDWDWQGAERRYLRALDTSPNSWWVHWGYATLLSALGRHDEAVTHMRRAQELDPVNPTTHVHLAQVYRRAGRYESALEVLKGARELFPDSSSIVHEIPPIHEVLGRYDDAITARRTLFGMIGQEYHADAHRAAYQRAGEQGYWRWILETPGFPFRPRRRANAFVALGRHDEALSILEELVEQRKPHMVFIKVNPAWQPLHDEPRFQALLSRMGLN